MIAYYPVLRGKQYELIALRELAEHFSDKFCAVHPVIEPVRSRGASRLRATCEALWSAGISHTILFNPTVGDFADSSAAGIYPITDELREDISPLGAILDSTESIARTLRDYALVNPAQNPQLLLFKRELGSSAELQEFIEAAGDATLMIPPAVSAGRYLRFNRAASAILLNDNFKPRSRNLDYVSDGPELFTSSHLYASLDGYHGVADYLTIGEDFNEGGFLPRVVAIHWTYLDSDGEVWIRHFTSGESSRAGDVPGKFLTAATKLVEAFADSRHANIAFDAIRQYVADEKFPGLGTVKKLSMLNHMLVMNEAIVSSAGEA